MGTIYFAVNPWTQEAYELGKGTWWQIAENGQIDCTNPEKFLQKVYEQVYFYAGKHYAWKIAAEVSRLGPILKLVDDTKYHHINRYRFVGSRYLDGRCKHD